MIYIFDENAGKQHLTLKGETHKYLVKVRRHELGDELSFRNKESVETLHRYKIISLDARSLGLELLSSKIEEVKAERELHIAWCVIDSKSIEKVLPSLCEIGVSRISFIFCERSQKNFKLDFKRYERILEASMQQSGRSTYIEFDRYKNITAFIDEFGDTKVFDFTDNILSGESDFQRVLIGCEGGFSKSEKELLKSQEVFRLNTEMVLRSESAVVAVASKILL
ncbi:MAG: 16S rRNA (uracil(1498)-N(3))-methyltransferase [Campylobacterota bacterium]|nr:16S rRNA (uracil(1498)-N(3))-methyltransferase [Campylobacterota bacterium]